MIKDVSIMSVLKLVLLMAVCQGASADSLQRQIEERICKEMPQFKKKILEAATAMGKCYEDEKEPFKCRAKFTTGHNLGTKPVTIQVCRMLFNGKKAKQCIKLAHENNQRDLELMVYEVSFSFIPKQIHKLLKWPQLTCRISTAKGKVFDGFKNFKTNRKKEYDGELVLNIEAARNRPFTLGEALEETMVDLHFSKPDKSIRNFKGFSVKDLKEIRFSTFISTEF